MVERLAPRRTDPIAAALAFAIREAVRLEAEQGRLPSRPTRATVIVVNTKPEARLDATTFGGSHSVTRAVSLVLNPRITLRSMRVEPTPIGPGEAWQICQQALAPAAGAHADLNEVVKPGRGWAYDPDLGRRSRGGGTDMLTDTVATVVALWRYPVKSMMGEQLNAAEVTDRGLLGDRAYALVDRETGKVASAKFPRKWPTLLAHRATYVEPPTGTDDLPAVRITLPDGRIIRSDDPDVDATLSADVGRDVALDRSAPAAPSLEEYWPDIEGLDHRDALTDEAMPPGTFFDLGIVHLLSTATLDELRQRNPEGRFEVRRFRPNVVVRALEGQAGFVENGWVGQALTIGDDVRLRITQPCPRCVMTTVAQDDLPKDPGILRTAALHNDVNVGVYATVERPGRILRGDEVRLVPS